MNLSKELTAASATPIVLGLLMENDSYGYAIIKEVKLRSENQLEWTEGMLYPVLHRLEKNGYIESYWKKSEQSRKRKFYSITQDGISYLKDLKEQWATVNRVLNKNWTEKIIILLGQCLPGKRSIYV